MALRIREAAAFDQVYLEDAIAIPELTRGLTAPGSSRASLWKIFWIFGCPFEAVRANYRRSRGDDWTCAG